ncbi:MAG: hypothetical protein ACFFC7_34805 [Candidatus Hermodarchaeota archaeon]
MKDLVANLETLVPWIIAFPQSYKSIWKKLGSISTIKVANNMFTKKEYVNLIPINSETDKSGVTNRKYKTEVMIEYQLPSLPFYFLCRTFYLSNQINGFPVTNYGTPISYSWIDDLYREINSIVTWKRNEIDDITQQLQNHKHPLLSRFGQQLRWALELEFFDIKSLTAKKEPLTKEELLSSMNFPHNMTKEEFSILLDCVEKIGGINTRIWFIQALKRPQPTLTILDIYNVIFKWFKQIILSQYDKDKGYELSIMYHAAPSDYKTIGPLLNDDTEKHWTAERTGLFMKETIELWRRIGKKLFEEHFEETVEELDVTPLKLFPVDFLPRDCLVELLSYYETKSSNEAREIVEGLFEILYPKVWYSDPNFWYKIFDSGDLEN